MTRYYSFLFCITCLWLSLPAAVPARGIAPGLDYSVYKEPGPNVVHVLRMDCRRPELGLKIGFPEGRRNYSNKETVSRIAGRYQSSSRKVLAAVNASFFGPAPAISGMLVSQGDYIQIPAIPWDCWVHTRSGQNMLGLQLASPGGRITFPGGKTLTVHRLNRIRRPDSLALYTPHYGESTGTTVEGIEVIVKEVSYPMTPDKEISGLVSAIHTGAESLDNPIPSSGLVLSARGRMMKPLQGRVRVGQRLRLRFDLSPGDWTHTRTALSGAGVLILNGEPAQALWSRFSTEFKKQNPRTALGWNQQYLYLVAVDGRRPGYSEGMTFQQLAEFLATRLQCREALNLDGGGSTTLFADGRVRNRPSDLTGERPVGCALMIVREEPEAGLPLVDNFDASGRENFWRDKYTYNELASFVPSASDGDGYVLQVMDPAGGYETVSAGHNGLSDYLVEADFYCDYRPQLAEDGFERIGLFAHDNGNGAFESARPPDGNCYCLTWDSDNGRLRAGKSNHGWISDYLQDNPVFLRESGWHQFRIEIQRDRLKFYVDNQLLVEKTDHEYSHGPAGAAYHEYFQNNENMRPARVDNFRLVPLKD